MGKNEQFHQYGYDHYLKAPKKPGANRAGSSVAKTSLGRSLQSPAVATVALLVAAVVFVGVVIVTYPESNVKEKAIPIVQADLRPIKRSPDAPGGMSIRHSESTVLSRSVPEIEDGVENLLARVPKSEPVMKDDALEMSKSEADAEAAGVVAVEPKLVDEYLEASADEIVEPEPIEVVSAVEVSNKSSSVIEVVSSDDLDDQNAGGVLQKIGSSSAASVSSFEKRAAVAAVASKPKHLQMHAAGQSPKTLEYVRSVLKGETQARTPAEVSKIEPAAGAAEPKVAVAIAPGDFYVQLASIKDQSRAGKEWLSMKSKYSALSDSDYRVQQANVKSGTFYRIQAGPMSKSSADRVCNSLKAAKKPGGCLVVKK